MNLARLSKSLVLNTGALALVSVGLVYVLTHSGALMLGLAGIGLVLVALGGGTAGQVSASGAGFAESAGLGGMVEDMGIWPGSSSAASGRARLLFYGLGLVLWSLTVLGLFSSSLR